MDEKMINSNKFGFYHIFKQSPYSFTKDELSSDKRVHGNKPLTFVLLHGTGGNEEDLISVGEAIEPSASILSPRGKILENGMPRFFKRLAEGVFDIEDLKIRTRELAEFIQNSSQHYDFDLNRTMAVGFSNGANIASSVLLLYPQIFQGAILFRAMIPLVPKPLPNLSRKQILLSAGTNDPIVSKIETENLSRLFQESNAIVTLEWQKSGHNLVQEDISVARKWISDNFAE